ncbi:MAG: hypothetical protein V1721_00050 [Pseudomonadota bacterium]
MDTQRTGKLPDKKIIDLLDALEKNFGLEYSNVHINGVQVEHKNAEHKKLLSVNDSYAITSASITTASRKFTVLYERGISKQTGPNNSTIREASSYFDEITITTGKTGNGTIMPSVPDTVLCHQIIRQHITNVIPSNVNDGADNATGLLQAQIASLSTQYQDMIAGIDQRRGELEKAYDSKVIALENKHKEKQENFEIEQKKGKEKLTTENELLEQKAKALDDRDHRHVRRDLRANINEDIKKRLGLGTK